MWTSLADALFPMVCVRCQAEGHAWCRPAGEAAPWPMCFACRRPYHPEPRGRCHRPLPLLTVGPYADPDLRYLIQQWKYEGYWALSQAWAELLAGQLTEPAPLCPIPLHWQRRLARGYNQAEVLAGQIANRLGQPVCRLLNRTRPTQPQAQLADADRSSNLRGAFVGQRRPTTPNIVWLVDDVVTSGATVREALRILRPICQVAGIVAIAHARPGQDRHRPTDQ